MKFAALFVALSLALSGCGGCGSDSQNQDAAIGDASPPFNACDADPASFVRQSFVALIGRRPKSQAEVDVYVDLYNAAVAKQLDAKDTVARAIMAEPEFTERWTQATMDAMHVQRTNIQNEAECWDGTLRSTVTPALATAIRDQPATGAGDGTPWNMADLIGSALALDDLTPLYRAELFSMIQHPIPAANVPDVEAELARRADFGATFDSAYMHRDTVCLDCHNSQASVTDDDDPMKDRFWPVPGLPEQAVYGAFRMIDPDKAHTAFRSDGFTIANNRTAKAWGWDSSCGAFRPSVTDDIAGVSGKLASVVGLRTTVFDLDKAMKHGFDTLRGQAPVLDGNGQITDPDTALAWLITLKMTEDMWISVQGTPLTIANYFPRNQAASDTLNALALRYVQSGYSVKALLAAIVASDYFNRKPAEDGCGASPYTYPNVYNPWVISDTDPAKRLNGPGDAVSAIDARTLVSAVNAALEWPLPPAASRFPEYGGVDCELSLSGLAQACNFGQCCDAYHAVQAGGVSPAVEVPFERGVGMFLKNSDKGFRGLDFQARLVWENHANACNKPTWVTMDFIDKLLAAGTADATATARDLVAALKDRIVGEPAIDADAESAALTTLVGSLDGPASGVTSPKLRLVCSALIQSPQFLLTGIAGRGGDLPKLTPANAQYDAVCADVAAHVPGATCAGKLALP